MANVAAFLLSRRSSGINAQTLVVDAGMSVNYFDRELVRRSTRWQISLGKRLMPTRYSRGADAGFRTRCARTFGLGGRTTPSDSRPAVGRSLFFVPPIELFIHARHEGTFHENDICYRGGDRGAVRRVDLFGAAEQKSSPANLGFLEAGRDYSIRFPESDRVFESTESGTAPAVVQTDNGQTENRAGTWTAKYAIGTFRLVRFGTGSWVLLKFPANIHDSFKWEFQRRAMATLASPEAEKKIRAKPDGEQRLEKLKKQAAEQVPTTEAWVNLDRAVLIADVPTEELEWKATMTPAPATPSALPRFVPVD